MGNKRKSRKIKESTTHLRKIGALSSASAKKCKSAKSETNTIPDIPSLKKFLEEYDYKKDHDTRYQSFNICVYEENPKTGEPLYDFDQIIQRAENCKSIEHKAYVQHDRDVIKEDDVNRLCERLRKEYAQQECRTEDGLKAYIEENCYLKVGEKKKKHGHMAIRLKAGSKRSIRYIAHMLGIEPQCIDLIRDSKRHPTGEYKDFLDCVYYMTHKDDKQRDLGKAEYEWSEIKGTHDWEEEYAKLLSNRERFGGRTLKDGLRYAVEYNGMTLNEVREQYPDEWIKDFDRLKKCRQHYIENLPMPVLRLNYYVDGDGGMGKNTACKALARALFPAESEKECYFEFGGENVSFDNYEGQPVIIWNDVRAVDLIMRFGHGEIFDIFDSHPTTSNHHVKFGSIKLTNAVNIVNGIQPYKEFLDGLAGEYRDRHGVLQVAEDKGQAYRRFPIIMCLRESDFDILLNKGVAEGTREYTQYMATKHIQGSFARMAMLLEGKARETVAINMLKPAIECTELVKAREKDKISDVNQLPEEFINYGKTTEQIAKETRAKEDTLARQNKAETYIISRYSVEVKKDKASSVGHLYLQAMTQGGEYKEIHLEEVICTHITGSHAFDEAVQKKSDLNKELRDRQYIKIGEEYHPLLHTKIGITKEFCEIGKYIDLVYENIDELSWLEHDMFYGEIDESEPTEEELKEAYEETQEMF